MGPVVIAHRTCPRDAAENSLPGIRAAAIAGADAVEVDVRLTLDGRPVLLHDARLLRTTGRPWRIDAVASERAHGLRLRGGGTLPSFSEALDALGPTMGMAIDVKDPSAASAVVREVAAHRLQSRCRFWSQHTAAVTIAVEADEGLEVSLLRDTHDAVATRMFVDDARRLGAHGISAHWSQVGSELRERCDLAGLHLYAWCKTRTIDRGRLGLLDGLVTDWPGPARELIDASSR